MGSLTGVPHRLREAGIAAVSDFQTPPTPSKSATTHVARTKQQAVLAGRRQLARLTASGFTLSRGDRMVVEYAQLLTTVGSTEDALDLADNSEMVIEEIETAASA